MGIIDTHTHINHGVPRDQKFETELLELEDLRRIGLAADIDKMFCSTFASVITPEFVVKENEYMFELAKNVDYLYQWVVVEPRTPETFEQAKRMLNTDKCVGIKLMPSRHKYNFDDFGDSLCSIAAEYGATMLIHPSGGTNLYLPFADKYPDATFILAHLGDATYTDVIDKSKHGNIYTDIATSSSVLNNLLECTVNRVGSERILFGTDTYAPGFVRGRVEYALISEKDKENILKNNAERLFSRFLNK